MSLGQGANVSFTERCRGELSPAYEAARDSETATRILDIDWEDYRTLMEGSLGYAVHRESGRIHRWLPEAFPDNAAMYAVGLSFKPIGDDPTTTVFTQTTKRIAVYGSGRATIRYAKLPYYVKPWSECAGKEYNRFVEEKYKPGARALMLPRGTMKFAEGSQKGGEFQDGANRLEPSAKIEWRWIGVPKSAVPWSIVNSSIGKVNNAAFSSVRGTGISWTVGTLLLEDVDTTHFYYDPYGSEVYDITYFAAYDPLGHNKVPHKVTEGTPPATSVKLVYELVSTDGEDSGTAATGKYLHDYFSWESLFSPPAPP